MIAAESAMGLSWPDAVMLSVLFVCVAAVVIYFLHVLGQSPPRQAPKSKAPTWTSETTTIKSSRPNPSDPPTTEER